MVDWDMLVRLTVVNIAGLHQKAHCLDPPLILVGLPHYLDLQIVFHLDSVGQILHDQVQGTRSGHSKTILRQTLSLAFARRYWELKVVARILALDLIVCSMFLREIGCVRFHLGPW